MAAYAALQSLMYIIKQIEHHPRPPISLDKTQVESLTEKVTFLQEFLEGYSHVAGYNKEADPLELRIADAASAAEDVIESYILDQIYADKETVDLELRIANAVYAAGDVTDVIESHVVDQNLHPSTSLGKEISSIDLNEAPQQVTDEMESLHIGYTNEADPLELHIANAAYAAEDVIEYHIFDQILPPSISLGKEISSIDLNECPQQVIDEMGSLQIGYTNEADPLELRIGNAAYANVIESHIVHQILPPSTSLYKEISSIDLNEAPQQVTDEMESLQIGYTKETDPLEQVIDEMETIKREVMEIKEKIGGVQHHLLQRSSNPAASFRSSSTGQNMTMVGFDDVLIEVMDKLTRGQLDRQIIPIVGMGGIGKTTLAENVYKNSVVTQHFQVRAWVTVSQEYRLRDILEKLQEGGGGLSQMNEFELGENLHKRLSGRRYVIIIDDIWDIKVWDQIRRFFPDNKNGSRIVITTRISDFRVTNSHIIKMGFLDKNRSWSLFSKIVFGEEGCPVELKGIGEKIVENCRGLPLSIVVVGGLLTKSGYTQENWEYIANNTNSIVNSEDDESCLKILHMSYNQLPIYLKPCFLYMGIFFREDEKISVSELVNLWVAEGFLKPISGKIWEEIAEKCLKELINRNLVLVGKLGSTGNIKYCYIHDLLRDLCLREAQKQRFYNVIRQRQRQYMPYQLYLDFELEFVNSRYLFQDTYGLLELPFSLDLFWNLHTLIVEKYEELKTPFEIWNMPQLRHLKCEGGLHLQYPPSGGKVGVQDGIILENLQTLGRVINFKCCKEVVKRIPNIKKLSASYYPSDGREMGINDFCHLQKLESLSFSWTGYRYPRAYDESCSLQNLSFPRSLKKLNLVDMCYYNWEDNLEKIGSLPYLEKLSLRDGCFNEGKWETVEGHFPKLKFLQIDSCRDLKNWITESSHFPCLERLVLQRLDDLTEIPSEIGEITTLELIKLDFCSDSVIFSAKKIIDEHKELYGEVGLQVRVETDFDKYDLERLAGPNFHISYDF